MGMRNRKKRRQSVKPHQQLDSVKTMVNEKLNNYSYQNLFFLKGQVDKIDVQGIYIEPEGIRVTVAVRGAANIVVGTKAQLKAIPKQ